MSQFDVTTLTDITSSTTGIAAAETNSASDVTTWMTEAAADMAAANDAAQAIASSQSGSTIAWNLQGEIFFDTDTAFWLGDPDGSGHDDEFLTRLSAYNHALATGGTATHKLMGVIGRDTTASARTTTGDFTAFTLPGGTLAANGQAIRVTFWGTRSGAVGTFSLQPIFGTTNVGTAFASTINSLTDWEFQLLIVRTAAATQDCTFHVTPNSDATGSTTLADVDLTVGETLSGDLAVKLNLSAVSAGTVTQEGFIVEYLG